jgi:hypothetical protein
LINKVNNVIDLLQVKSAKEAENDPGSSSGSGLAYERPPQQEQNGDPNSQEPTQDPVVSELDKPGMTGVVLDFYEHKPKEHTPSIGLTTRYQTDLSRTKGLLLNKKAE